MPDRVDVASVCAARVPNDALRRIPDRTASVAAAITADFKKFVFSGLAIMNSTDYLDDVRGDSLKVSIHLRITDLQESTFLALLTVISGSVRGRHVLIGDVSMALLDTIGKYLSGRAQAPTLRISLAVYFFMPREASSTFLARFVLCSASFCLSAGSERASISTAKTPALVAPALPIAIVATGTPPGIMTVE